MEAQNLADSYQQTLDQKDFESSKLLLELNESKKNKNNLQAKLEVVKKDVSILNSIEQEKKKVIKHNHFIKTD